MVGGYSGSVAVPVLVVLVLQLEAGQISISLREGPWGSSSLSLAVSGEKGWGATRNGSVSGACTDPYLVASLSLVPEYRIGKDFSLSWLEVDCKAVGIGIA
jgi:hypothetical protein